MDWLDYREALGIGLSDFDKTNFFITKTFNFFEANLDFSQRKLDDSEYYAFCNMTGSTYSRNLYSDERFKEVFNILSRNSNSIKDFLAYYVAFVNCQSDNDYKLFTKEMYIEVLGVMLNQSHIPFDIKEDKGRYFIFPKGAKELDDALVSEPLDWLSDYPEARKTYVIALKQYSEGIYIRDVADNLRKALEAFLQEFLGNKNNLETNKNEICKYLGKAGVDAGISGLFQPLINAYKNINDRIAKHNDAVDKKMLEFLLYQTGVLIRMVISVKKAEEA